MAKYDFPFLGIRRNWALEATAFKAQPEQLCFVRRYVNRLDLNVRFERVFVEQC